VLAATLRCAQIDALNNLGAHKSERARKLIEGRGCRLLFPPPYSSPDFSPIREAFSKTKSYLQKAQARAREALV
jgi:transposase